LNDRVGIRKSSFADTVSVRGTSGVRPSPSDTEGDASGSVSAYRHRELTRPVRDFRGAGVGEKSSSRGP
jgi:hypothetical protein